MDETVMKQLESVEIDVKGSMERMLNNEALFIRMLKKFAEDKNYSNLLSYWREGDTGQAFVCAHTLKGLTGNLGMKGIYAASGVIAELLRDLEPSDLDEARKAKVNEALDRLEEKYTQVADVLKDVM